MDALKILLALTAILTVANAQDLRTVTEPAIPPSCATLTASLVSHGGTLDAASEKTRDTARIQSAIDACAPGHAVVLRADSAHDAFLSGPLQLRTGVTLVVDSGAILFASRDPREYDLRPGVCGTIDQSGHGCKALINGDHAADSGVMGDGIIDGRGGEKIAGQDITWWELADKARTGGNQNNPRILILSHCDNFTLYRITLRNSPNFHVDYKSGNGFTVWGVKIYSPKRARNTDGIDPGNSTNSTRGGLVHDVVYEDVCIRNVTNPILMDTHYSFKGPEQDKIPAYNDVILRNVRILDAGKITLDGFDATHKLEMRFDNVIGDAPGELKISGSHATLAVGPGAMNLPVAGEDVTVTGTRGSGSANACANKFVPFPGR